MQTRQVPNSCNSLLLILTSVDKFTSIHLRMHHHMADSAAMLDFNPGWVQHMHQTVRNTLISGVPDGCFEAYTTSREGAAWSHISHQIVRNLHCFEESDHINTLLKMIYLPTTALKPPTGLIMWQFFPISKDSGSLIAKALYLVEREIVSGRGNMSRIKGINDRCPIQTIHIVDPLIFIQQVVSCPRCQRHRPLGIGYL